MLGEWFVSLVSVPGIWAVELSGGNLSKLGVDLQLLAGDHGIARQWALRLMEHPVEAGGIWYPSRHDDTRRNLALFQRGHSVEVKPCLVGPASVHAAFARRDGGSLLYGPPARLRDHPELMTALSELAVALLP